ncbi:MAG: response regulator [Candidatus Sedimenticola sp. (ex Thyasira tokunagai)]
MFKPFVQAGQSSSATKGTGLGLTISKSFVELMSGNMRVESSSGKGTLFFVDLPVILSSASEAVSIEAARPAVLGLEAGQTAWRILVVDDYPENRILLMTLLTEAGFEVREAENGKQAIALFRQWQPHFIWMDMRMPVMDGYEATTKIRLLPGGEEVKIVALTASAFKEQRNKIMASGCNEMVYKPFRVDDIFGSIQQHLGVRFIYEEEAGSVFSTTEQATDIGEATRMAALLPDPLFNDLKQAAINLDIEESYEALERIAETEPALANMLRACVDEMNFGTIQKVLKHE